MTRKLWVLSTVTLFGVSAMLAGVGLTRNAAACDEKAKTASVTSSDCCAKGGAKTASVDAKKVHNSMIKSAVVAPGAAPILNIAAFGGLLAAGGSGDCDWCPGASASMSAKECAAIMAASGCASKGTATTASYDGAIAAGHKGCDASATTTAASSGCATKGATTTAASSGCTGMKGSATTTASVDGAKAAGHNGCPASATTTAAVSHETSVNSGSMTMAAGGDGCDKASKNTNASAGAGGCCEGKSASAAGAKDEKCSTTKTASLKGLVDDMPYRENKRVVLAGSYACGHCSLEKTADCSPMLKTADGKVYPMLKGNLSSEMRGAEGKNLEVSGTVKKVDGVKYLDVKSYKVM